MNFEWDEEKNNANIQKHGFDFSDAWEAFELPMLVVRDNRPDYGEVRFAGLGTLEIELLR